MGKTQDSKDIGLGAVSEAEANITTQYWLAGMVWSWPKGELAL